MHDINLNNAPNCKCFGKYQFEMKKIIIKDLMVETTILIAEQIKIKLSCDAISNATKSIHPEDSKEEKVGK